MGSQNYPGGLFSDQSISDSRNRFNGGTLPSKIVKCKKCGCKFDMGKIQAVDKLCSRCFNKEIEL